ncbi:MAG: hypothetical protein CME82_11600 [Halomonas sp.]|nr:hypothetical protein [Halomonas sp.]
MANVKITDLPEVTEVADDDQVLLIDVSDNTAGPNGTDKRSVLAKLADLLFKYDVETAAELEASSPIITGRRAICRERADANYILAPSGYAAKSGDIVAANGRVWELQSLHDPRFYGAKGDGLTIDTQPVIDCATRYDGYVTSDKGLIFLVGTVPILSGQKFKEISFKLADNTNAECLSCERNAVGCEFIRVKVNGNRANNTGLCHGIRFNGSTDCKVIGCNIFDTEGNGVSAFIGDTSNVNLEIRDNTIRFTDGDSVEVRGSSGLRIIGNLCQSLDAGHNAIEFQEPHVDVTISNNVFLDERGNLFAIESAGASARVENFTISSNVFKGNYTGISGLFFDGTIKGNVFKGGIATWRSGIELASEDVIVEGNWIDNGSISIASHGSTVPVYNAKNVQIINNFVRNKGNDTKALYLGAAASATGTPTATDIKISGNTFDFTEATGTGGRALLIGQYSLLSQLDGIDITDNVILGDGSTASTRGILIDSLAGSGKVIIKGNRVSGFANNVNLTDDNLSRLILRNNDLEVFINNAFLDASTTTVVTNQDNDV